MTIWLPLKVVTESNTGGHWRVKANRAKQQLQFVGMALVNERKVPPLPVRVTFTRFGPRLLDSDNNVSAFKHCRDAVAAFYGTDDSSTLYSWEYRQEQARDYGIEILIESGNK